MQIRPMTINDYDEVFAMWQITTKRALSKADERDQIERYLLRNAGMSQVAVVDGKIVGTVLAGHDGRRGFIHHMAVLPDYRRRHRKDFGFEKRDDVFVFSYVNSKQTKEGIEQ